MNNIYLVWMTNEDIEPMIIGVATTEEKAKKMIEKSKETFEDAFEYNIQPWKEDVITIDDVKHEF